MWIIQVSLIGVLGAVACYQIFLYSYFEHSTVQLETSMDDQKIPIFFGVILVLVLILSGCGPIEQRLQAGTQAAAENGSGGGDFVPQDGSGGGVGDQATVDVNALATSIQASLESLAELTPSATKTVVPERPTMTQEASVDEEDATATVPDAQFTALAETLAAIETGTLTPTNTTAPTVTMTQAASPEPTEVPCLGFRFVAHVTYPPGSVVNASTSFYKSWQVQNTGTCTWNGEYALVYDSGFQLGGQSPLPLGSGVAVAPGQYVTLTIRLWSNPQPGTYTGEWLLQDDDGNAFGGGPELDEALIVHIVVPGEMTPEFTSPASTAPPFYTSTPTP
jgi:hypothetical protein